MTSFQKKRDSFMDDICLPISDSSDISTLLIIDELESLKDDEVRERLEELDIHELRRINEMYEELIKEQKKEIEEIDDKIEKIYKSASST